MSEIGKTSRNFASVNYKILRVYLKLCECFLDVTSVSKTLRVCLRNHQFVSSIILELVRQREFVTSKGSPPLTEVERAISRVLADKADLPRVVTLSVSTVGGLLVVVNVVLVACVLHRRRQRQGSQGKPVCQVPVHPGGGIQCLYWWW